MNLITEIGIIAGEIWHYLDKNDTASIKELTSSLDRPANLVMMSLGWLAREGHVLVDCQHDEYTITLRDK